RGLADRIDVVGGDFFQAVPPGDAYVVKMILHDWDDDPCVQILEKCRQAMKAGGRIPIVEVIGGGGSDPGPGALFAMKMVAVVPGQEGSLAEYDALLSAAGLQRTAVVPTRSAQSVVDAA